MEGRNGFARIRRRMLETVAYIASSGRTGSTLLDLLLSRHQDVIGVGEVHRLSEYARDPSLGSCACGAKVTECPFWRSALIALRNRLSKPELDWQSWPTTVLRSGRLEIRDLLAASGARSLWIAGGILLSSIARYRSVMRNSWTLYETLCELTGTRVLVDSTKDGGRLKGLYYEDPKRLRIVLQVRDGRAVAASQIHREGVTMADAARSWLVRYRRLDAALRGIPGEKILYSRYEDLCLNPSAELQRIYKFLHIPDQDVVVDFKKELAHNIGGNPMLSRRTETDIRLDESWRTKLSPSDLEVFERVGGKKNRAFGYND